MRTTFSLILLGALILAGSGTVQSETTFACPPENRDCCKGVPGTVVNIITFVKHCLPQVDTAEGLR